MRILWLINVKLPMIYRLEGEKNKTIVGGWLDQISEKIIEEHQLVVCYPTDNVNSEEGNIRNLSYYGIYFNNQKLRNGRLDEREGISILGKILEKEDPDIIHIHGTEFQYSYFMTKAAENIKLQDRVVISIQGLVGVYAKHYLFNLPIHVILGKTIKEILLREGVYAGYKNYMLRGKAENKAIQSVKYVIGRTNWDKGCTNIINPNAKYLFCNETLRSIFYNDEWKYKNCVPHSIFVSQASYPIKGFHILLKALTIVKSRYPDLQVKVAGSDITKDNWIKGSKYALYIQKLIHRYGLENNIYFLGPQTAEQMKNEMLNANIFVSASTIENSPNSLGEGMILGLPCISSDVGGVSDLLIHNKEGYIFPLDEMYMLAYYIMDIFANTEKATEMGRAARKHALKTHDADVNYTTLIEIYKKIKG